MRFFLRDETDARLRAFGETRSRALRRTAVGCYALMLVMQLVTLLTFHGEPTGDASRYVGDALRCLREGHFYPTASDFVGGGTAGTGYVNLLILLFRLTGSVRAAYWTNLLLVQLLLASVLFLAYRATRSEDVCARTAIIFCLSVPYWAEICVARTEILFTALAFLALALLYRRHGLPFVTGVLLAAANWVRPLGLAFLAAALWSLLYGKAKWHAYVRLLAGVLAAVAAISLFTYRSSGEFVYQPTVSSGNLLIGSNEDADGSYDEIVFSPGKAGYIPPQEKAQMTYKQINARYSAAAKQWIRENPGRYLALMPKKLFYMYIMDTYSGDVYFDNDVKTSGREYVTELLAAVRGQGRTLTWGDAVICWGQAFYMLTFALFLCGVIRSMRRGYWRSLSFLYGVFLIGTAMTMLTVGSGRYHFPYLPILQITAAAWWQSAAISVRARRKGTTFCGAAADRAEETGESSTV
ncbi:MAG: hypothetical protein IJT44_06050 [Clostridia bacterium]|nr:hypothetical protein [Clostridia bacterium]